MGIHHPKTCFIISNARSYLYDPLDTPQIISRHDFFISPYKTFFMEPMIGLKDLLKHEIVDLYSAEEQIIEALPPMIDKAKNGDLKKALQEHLKITEEQKKRLDQVQQLLSEDNENEKSQEPGEEKKGFFSRLFRGSNGKEKCKGMEGLITEGKKI